MSLSHQVVISGLRLLVASSPREERFGGVQDPVEGRAGELGG